MPKIQKAFEEDAEPAAKETGLRYVSDQKPGINRRKKGGHFVYYDQRERRVNDAALLRRIRSTVIPPAWERVWIG